MYVMHCTHIMNRFIFLDWKTKKPMCSLFFLHLHLNWQNKLWNIFSKPLCSFCAQKLMGCCFLLLYQSDVNTVLGRMLGSLNSRGHIFMVRPTVWWCVRRTLYNIKQASSSEDQEGLNLSPVHFIKVAQWYMEGILQKS